MSANKQWVAQSHKRLGRTLNTVEARDVLAGVSVEYRRDYVGLLIWFAVAWVVLSVLLN
jgi:hypothetical protein